MSVAQLPAALTGGFVVAALLSPTPPGRAVKHVFHLAFAAPVTSEDVLRIDPKSDPNGRHVDDDSHDSDERSPLLSLSPTSTFSPSNKPRHRWPAPWVTATISFTALVHLVWYLSTSFVVRKGLSTQEYWPVIAWVYILARTVLLAQPTPSYDSMVLLTSLTLVPAQALVATRGRFWAISALVSLGLIAASLFSQLTLPLFAYSAPIAQALGLPLQHPAQKLEQVPLDRTADQYPAPDEVCTLWQWMSNSWVSPLIRIGSVPNGTGLKGFHIWNVSTPTLTKYLMPVWDSFPRGTSIWWRIFLVNRRDILTEFLLTVGSYTTQYAQPLVLQRVLEGVAGDRPRREAYLAAVVGIILATITSQLDMNRFFHARRGTMRVRSQLTGEIYRKALRERSQVEEPTTKSNEQTPSSKGGGVGQAVSLLAVDMQLVAIFLWHLSAVYATPLEIVLCLTLLYRLLGWSAFAGALVLVLAFPVQSVLLRVQLNLTRKLGAARDARMTSLSEYVSSLKGLKLLALSSLFVERIDNQRRVEMRLQLATQLANCATQFLWTLAPALVALAAFGSYTLLAGHKLTVPLAFTALNLYGRLARPMRAIPSLASEIVTLRVSTTRLHDFLNREEVPEGIATMSDTVEFRSLGPKDEIKCQDATFGWKWPSSIAPRPPVQETQSNVPPHSLATYLRTKLANKKASSYGAANSHPPPPSGAMTPQSTVGTSEGTSLGTSPGTSRTPSIAAEALFELRDVSLSVELGLTLVTGPTGSGKSMLLLALLGETRLLEGSLSTTTAKKPFLHDPETGLTGGIAYCAQTPWLQQASIRDNILFGSPGTVDEQRYQDALKAACLLPDLSMWEARDNQEIGEGGISLSGGQRARVALARAAYSRARTVLLDDVLSAVDAHTGAELVKMLAGPLFEGRCVLLATHHVSAVARIAQRAIKLDAGRVVAQGSVSELQKQGHLPEAQVLESTSTEADEKKDNTLEDQVAADLAVEHEVDQLRAGGQNADARAAEEIQAAARPPAESQAQPQQQKQNIVTQELVRSGSVKFPTYAVYLRACGYFFLGMVGLTLMLAKLIDLGATVWLAYWAQGGNNSRSMSTLDVRTHTIALRTMRWVTPSLYTLLASSDEFQVLGGPLGWLPPAECNPVPYVVIYGLISLLSSLGLFTYSALCFFVAYRASRMLFRQMLASVSRATTRWLDATPSGQILNRFAKDISSLDGGLLDAAMQVLDQGFSFLTAFGALITALPSFVVPALLLVWVYTRVTSLYVKASRDCRRLDSVSRSPIYSAYGEALKGCITIRACSAENTLQNRVYGMADRSNSYHYAWHICNSWLLVRVDLMGAMAVFFTQVLALLGAVNPGVAAIAITQAANFTLACYWLGRRWSTFEQQLTSIERVVDYLPPNIPHEPPEKIEDRPVPAIWPSKQATIKFDNVWLRYDPTFDPVLKGVSFESRPGEKIGIVGTTGSGKSTCASALLRFVDPYQGSISIEGIDIRSLGLYDLRSRISFIPQDPVLFQGTVRENLDPFDQHTDEERLDALVQVRLSRGPTDDAASAAETLEGAKDLTLDSPVTEGGSDLSHGQRQLLAMARTLLSHNQIVIADEATASVDYESDQAIQQVIRDRFQSQVVLVIAHRLTTIVDFDRVLVLDKGQVVEFDTPAKLIEMDGGAFQTLAKRSGSYDALVRMAHQKK